MKGWIRVSVAVASAALLGACAYRAPVAQHDNAPIYSPQRGPASTVQYGSVVAVDAIHSSQRTTGSGALIGGVVGAVVGRQFGDSSNGRAAGTAVGAVGGAIIGNEIEKQQHGITDGVRVSVRFDNGATRAFEYNQTSIELRVGDRVRVEGDRLVRL